MRPALLYALLTVLLSVPRAPAAEIFQWVDERGVIHLTDDFSRIPPHVRAAPDSIVHHDFADPVADPALLAPQPSAGAKEVAYERSAWDAGETPKHAGEGIVQASPADNVTIIVVTQPSPSKPCRDHGCTGRFRPDFNNRRYIHPGEFNGGTRQYIHPNAFTGDAQKHRPFRSAGYKRK